MFKYETCFNELMGASTANILRQGQKDLEWFNSSKSELLARYDNSFVAFKDRKVIGADADLGRLLQRLRRNGIDTSHVLIEFVSKVIFI